MFRVPLAWKNLTHDVRKFAIALAGICFAVVLMFQQRGFNNALFDSAVVMLRQMDADIVIFDNHRFSLSAETRFDRDVLDIAASCPGVVSAHAVYTENSIAFLQTENNKPRPIRVIGFDTQHPILLDKSGNPLDVDSKLPRSQTALIDVWSKHEYGFNLNPSYDQPQAGELAGKKITINGTFNLGRDFANDGSLVVSKESIQHYFPFRKYGDPLGVVDIGLIKCDDATASGLQTIKRDLQERLSGRKVIVYTKQEFIDKEIAFWSKATPIGYIFLVGSIMGFVVGVIICYQILANDIADHMSEFATLKAMGYSNFYFFRLVITESIYLSVIGFIPGFLISMLLFAINSQFTGLNMLMTWDRALFILGLTMIMCMISGVLALRKLISTDPAELF